MLLNKLNIPAGAPLMECVANFSEGRNKSTINIIAESIKNTAGQKLLHIDSSISANRTVMTFAGNPEAVTEAAFSAIRTAALHIDMSRQQGAHPRIGATDVCPFVPLANITMEEVVHWSEVLGERVGKELGIPVYLYEYSARYDHRKALPDIRKGQYEGIEKKVFTDTWQPDFWDDTKDLKRLAQTGATVIGARKILVAFNISLDTKDENVAAKIAQRMRSSGYREKQTGGVLIKREGLLTQLRAIGWYMEDFGCAQVSMNLLDYETTSPLKAMQVCQALAKKYGTKVTGCELIGLIPETCILEAGRFALQENSDTNISTVINAGIAYLMLDAVKPFRAEEHILEYVLRSGGR